MTQKSMEEKQENFIHLFDKAPIKHVYGMVASYTDSGARFDLPYNPHFDHALNGVHGGVIATLLDNAGWFTVAPYYENWVATVEFSVRLLEHVKAEDLYSVGKIIKKGKRLSVAEMEVRTAKGRLVAVGTGTFAETSAVIDFS